MMNSTWISIFDWVCLLPHYCSCPGNIHHGNELKWWRDCYLRPCINPGLWGFSPIRICGALSLRYLIHGAYCLPISIGLRRLRLLCHDLHYKKPREFEDMFVTAPPRFEDGLWATNCLCYTCICLPFTCSDSSDNTGWAQNISLWFRSCWRRYGSKFIIEIRMNSISTNLYSTRDLSLPLGLQKTQMFEYW